MTKRAAERFKVVLCVNAFYPGGLDTRFKKIQYNVVFKIQKGKRPTMNSSKTLFFGWWCFLTEVGQMIILMMPRINIRLEIFPVESIVTILVQLRMD